MKITIAVPSNRTVRPKTMESLFGILHGHDFHIVVATEGYDIAENRAYLTVQAINNGSDYLLFIDDDMVFPPDTLERLLAHKKDIVGVIYHSRNFEPRTTVALKDGTELHDDKIPTNGLIECSHVGTGIMLINTDVFSKIDKPWFQLKKHVSGFTEMGEDAWFCKKAIEKGIDIWCDSTFKIGHLGDIII